MKSIAAVLLAVSATVNAQNLEPLAGKILTTTGVGAAWSRSITGQGIKVGVIDQGFDLGHADLAGQVFAARNFYSPSAVSWGSHGTAMASIIAGKSNQTGTLGIAPMAQLVLAQVGPGGTSTIMQERAIYQALDWLSQQQVAVINMSFGADYTKGMIRTMIRNPVTGIYFAGSSELSAMNPSSLINNYQIATSRGSILVAAAGNQGLPYAEFPGMYATRTTPNGDLVLGGRMLIVGSVDSNNVIANFSNRAGHVCQNSAQAQCQDRVLTRDYFVVAPGVNLPAAQPRALGTISTTVTGTSGSAAFVSGGIALIRQAWPLLRPEQIVNLLLMTTRDLGAPGVDNVYGRGLVDFDRATRPQGTLTMARPLTLRSGSGFVGLPITQSIVLLPGGLAKNIRSTSVVQNSQAIDQLGRNYRVDLSPAILPFSALLYKPESPWLGQSGFQESAVMLDHDVVARVYSNYTGTAVELEKRYNKLRPQLQYGVQQQHQGYLGMVGQAGMSLGSSTTNWTMLGLEYQLNNDYAILARYGHATTMVTNSPMSMFITDPKVTSQSWNVGFKNNNLTMTFGIPVSVRSGAVTVSTVTDYEYRETQQGLVADPIISSQRFDLKLPVQEYQITMNYRHNLSKSGWINYNMQHRINAGGQTNTTGFRAGVNFTWMQ